MMTSLAWFTLSVSLAVGAAPPVADWRLSLEDAVRLAGRQYPARTAERAYEVSVAYWDLYRAQAVLHTRELGRIHAEDLLALGVATGSRDNGLARTQEIQFQNQVWEARQHVADAETELTRLTGSPLRSRIVLTEAAAEGIEPPDWPAAVLAALHGPYVRELGDWLDLLTALDTVRERCHLPQRWWFRLLLTEARERYQARRTAATTFLGIQYKRVIEAKEQILSNRAQRAAFEEQATYRRREFLIRGGTNEVLLESQRYFADAFANEQAAIASLNKAIAVFEYAKRR